MNVTLRLKREHTKRFLRLDFWRWSLVVCSVWAVMCGSGCSVRKYALKNIGDALAGSGTTFASDNDPELVRDAAPFSLKLMETVLADIPHHEGLLLAASSGFTQYTFGFVQQDADEMEDEDFAAASALRKRAAGLYLRAKWYGLRGLSVRYDGFAGALAEDPREAVRITGKDDVELLYWTAAAWASLISLSKDQPAIVADLPIVEALIDRALELDESYGSGAIHSFLISYEMSRQGATGDPAARSRARFDRAWDLSGGQQAAPLVSLAEAVCVQEQNVKEFDSLLNRALDIDPDANPDFRLVNLIMQKRARWLLSRRDELFLILDDELE